MLIFGAAATGFATAFSLILAIGAQNAFVLRQGLLNAHVFWVCLVCAVSDAILITLGVTGFGMAAEAMPLLPTILLWGGAIFLLVYGFTRLRAAWKNREGIELKGESKALIPTLLTTLAFTWLNPHVYLDTFGLIGAVSTNYPPLGPKLAFGIGAVTSSFVFFFSLGYGARLLAPWMQSPKTWVWLDVFIGLVMWALALMLILSAHSSAPP